MSDEEANERYRRLRNWLSQEAASGDADAEAALTWMGVRDIEAMFGRPPKETLSEYVKAKKAEREKRAYWGRLEREAREEARKEDSKKRAQLDESEPDEFQRFLRSLSE